MESSSASTLFHGFDRRSLSGILHKCGSSLTDCEPFVAECAPFLLAQRALRAAFPQDTTTRDTLSFAAEMNLFRGACGLIMLYEAQRRLAVFETACGTQDMETIRYHSFTLWEFPSDDKLASEYSEAAEWPNAMYWKIWFSHLIKRCSRQRSPISHAATCILQCLVQLESKLFSTKYTMSCSEAALYELAQHQPNDMLNEAWIQQALAESYDLVGDAASSADIEQRTVSDSLATKAQRLSKVYRAGAAHALQNASHGASQKRKDPVLSDSVKNLISKLKLQKIRLINVEHEHVKDTKRGTSQLTESDGGTQEQSLNDLKTAVEAMMT